LRDLLRGDLEKELPLLLVSPAARYLRQSPPRVVFLAMSGIGRAIYFG